ncbi:PRC-barrel domain containing protein [Haloarcula litorea]|uniref:PRC-barrel domain containing protein n=1 Tax=Haloarcula litorea TaxID=3032579 RepID=UPI0023E85460|nr:PRC-barrel domain containing protein [Halomicroarcula sp. GDY20]
MSTTQISEDDVGKDVVSADGDSVGIVSGYRHGTARVDPDPGLATKLKTALGWNETDEEDYPLQEERVAEVTDEEIRLRADL